jgi:hypothetical protein
MRRLLLLVLVTASAAGAQYPPIGIIDFYGVRTLDVPQLRAALGVHVGDSVPHSRAAIEGNIRRLPRVEDISVNPVCCDNGRSIIYVGVHEAGTPTLHFAPAPQGSVRLPPDILRLGERFSNLLTEAITKGESGEDLSAGHSLMNYAPLRAVQRQFIPYATKDLTLLRNVLHTSADAEHRALAAQVIAYTPDKQAVVSDLLTAMHDPDGGVRNNAARALAVMAEYEQAQRDASFNIPYTPYVELLHSLDWTDLNKGSFVLVGLSASRDTALLHALRANAFEELVDIARWQSPGHALAGGVLLGRIAGLPEEEVARLLQRDREVLIARARARKF